MKIPFWRLVICFFGFHGPEEVLWTCRARRPWSKVQCLFCGHVRRVDG